MKTFTTITLLIVTLTFFVTLTTSGCRKSDRPVVQFVEGTVTLDGKPVADADVSFSPQAGQPVYYGTGRTDANGVYHLTSTRGGEFGKGVPAGHYDVVISKYLADAEEEKAALKQWEAANKGKAPEEQEPAPMSVMRHYLPERYADAKTSGLSAEVKKGKNVIDFAMKAE